MITLNELSKMVGVSERLLRIWEVRYGLMRPTRTEDGSRHYSFEDQGRVMGMFAYISEGMTREEAALKSIAESSSGDSVQLKSWTMNFEEAYQLLQESLDYYDEAAAQAILDGFFANFTLETIFREVFLSYLRQVGERWEAGMLSIGQEHFASNIFRGRLSELARDWAEGDGPIAILACPPGEIHEFGLMISGIMLHRSGWTIRYFGSSTPLNDVIDLAARSRPELFVLSSVSAKRFTAIIPQMRQLSEIAVVAIAGPGATQEIADECGATVILGDCVSLPLEVSKIINQKK